MLRVGRQRLQRQVSSDILAFMYYDYFLTHRALQIQKLCAAEREPRIELPSRLARSVSSKPVAELCRTIEDICRLPLGDEPERKSWGLVNVARRFLGGRQEASGDEDTAPRPAFPPEGRELVSRLETDLVRLRLGDDATAAELAGGIIQAIWLDHGFFNGLKPLKEHSEMFAYEFLYPTWLNLYAAASGAGKSEPKLAPGQIAAMFRFLDEREQTAAGCDPELIGLMALIVNRFSGDDAAALLQRTIDLCGCPDADLALSAAATVRPLRDSVTIVEDLLPLVRSYLTVESSLRKEALHPGNQLVPGGVPYVAAPAVLDKVLIDLEPQLGQDDSYATVLQQAARLLDAGGFDADFERLLTNNQPRAAELLTLMVPSGETAKPLSRYCQGLVACLLGKEQETTGQLDVQRSQAFAHQVAPRMDRIDESTRGLWDAEFANHPTNRRVLLDSCGEAVKRSQIAAHLLRTAKKATDGTRFFDLIELAAILDPAYDTDRLRRLTLSTRVLRLAISEGSIVRTQLVDLMQDLQENLPKSLTNLEVPGMVASSKSERLAKLYLTLHQERSTYSTTGRIGNFSMTHAGHGRGRR